MTTVQLTQRPNNQKALYSSGNGVCVGGGAGYKWKQFKKNKFTKFILPKQRPVGVRG